jgi:hypothetical protein
MADHDLGPKLPGSAGEFRKLLRRDMGQFDAGQELGFGVFIQISRRLHDAGDDEIQIGGVGVIGDGNG